VSTLRLDVVASETGGLEARDLVDGRDIPLTGEAPAVQAERALDGLRRGDPRAPSPPPGWTARRR
jgi:hypothetical protein